MMNAWISRSLMVPALLGAGAALCFMTDTPTTSQAEEAPARKKIVFVAGKPSHGKGQHEHRAGCMLLAGHLNKSGLPVEAVVVDNGWPADNAVFDGASAVVIYSDGGGGHPGIRQLATLRAMAKKGVGIGCIHYAVEVPKGEPGDAFLDTIGGYFETNWSVNPHWDASFVMPAHEISRGIKDYEMRDEWYYHMRFRKDMEGVTPILSTLPPAETLSRPDGPHSGNPHVRAAVLERKEKQHVMWAFERPAAAGSGRGFGFTGGHFHKNWQNDQQRRIVLNAIAWISGLAVPEQGVASPAPSDDQMLENLDPK
jgi:type 1 glutamine amidotransferase